MRALATTRNALTLSELPQRFRIQSEKPQLDQRVKLAEVLSMASGHRQLLPVERNHKQIVERHLQENKIKLADACADRIGLGFLKLTRRQDEFRVGGDVFSCIVPQFAIFSLDKAECEFKVEVTTSNYYRGRRDDWRNVTGLVVSTPGMATDSFGLWQFLPEPTYDRDWNHDKSISYHFWEYFISSIERIQSQEDQWNLDSAGCLWALLVHAYRAQRQNASKSFAYTVNTTFAGLIPSEVRAKIPGWQLLFDEVLLVAEAGDWVVDKIEERQVINPDPLVLGRIGENYWYLDKFDVTDAEEWIRRRFAARS